MLKIQMGGRTTNSAANSLPTVKLDKISAAGESGRVILKPLIFYVFSALRRCFLAPATRFLPANREIRSFAP